MRLGAALAVDGVADAPRAPPAGASRIPEIRSSRPGASRPSPTSSPHDPAHLFDGNMFYPDRYTLTYSDATLLQGLVATPFIARRARPAGRLERAFPLGVPALRARVLLCGLAPDRRSAGGASSRAILGGLYPFHTEHYSHMELQFFCFVPLAVLALLRMLAAPRMVDRGGAGPRRRAAVARVHVLRRHAARVPGRRSACSRSSAGG